MIETFLQGMDTTGKITTLLIVIIAGLVLIGMIINGAKDFIVGCLYGYEPKPSVPNCGHEDNLTKLCLRGLSGCATRSECNASVREKDEDI